MISLIMAESSIEPVPPEIRDHSAVTASARRLGRDPSEILLDNSWHFAAMRGLRDEIKRGRPDLVHFSLLAATGIPLYFEGRIRVYVHTIQDRVIILGDNVRLPKSFHRFAGIMEKLFREGVIKGGGRNLLELHRMDFPSLLERIDPARVVGLSTDGSPSAYEDVARRLEENTCLVVGGFPKGHFSDRIRRGINELFRLDRAPLETHAVLARVLYEYEKTIFI